MRILHFSDVHLPLRPGDLGPGGWFGKRGLGALNYRLGRGRCFERAAEKLTALGTFARDQQVDLALNTGDSTGLGTLPELRRARAALAPFAELPLGLVTLPGNHDVYVPDSVAHYETTFGDWIRTDRPDLAGPGGRWPFVRLFGDGLAVVGVDSARPNPQLWRSSGEIGAAQLAALRRILEDVRLTGRLILVMTHYAPRGADGRPDTRHHGLVDADAFLDACRGLTRGAILHGHIHQRYHVEPEGLGVTVYCAGSATKDGREGIWLFDLDGDELRARPGTWKDGAYELEAT